MNKFLHSVIERLFDDIHLKPSTWIGAVHGIFFLFAYTLLSLFMHTPLIICGSLEGNVYIEALFFFPIYLIFFIISIPAYFVEFFYKFRIQPKTFHNSKTFKILLLVLNIPFILQTILVILIAFLSLAVFIYNGGKF